MKSNFGLLAHKDGALRVPVDKVGITMSALPFFFFFMQSYLEERIKQEEKWHFENGVCGIIAHVLLERKK